MHFIFSVRNVTMTESECVPFAGERTNWRNDCTVRLCIPQQLWSRQRVEWQRPRHPGRQPAELAYT